MAEPAPESSFVARLALAFACFFALLFDAVFAGRVRALRERGPDAFAPASAGRPALASGAAEPKPEGKPREEAKPDPAMRTLADSPAGKRAAAQPTAEQASELRAEGARLLLGLLQREGRLIDFLEEDVASFSDADIGAAARVVHAGARKALRAHVELEPAHEAAEGGVVTVPEGFDPEALKLTGRVTGSAPFRGKLAHRGWRAKSTKLPVPVAGTVGTILAPAEVEL